MPRAQKVHDAFTISKAVNEIEKGKTIYKTAKKYKIPESTLRDHARGKYKGVKTNFGRDRCLSDEDETSLVSYILYMSERGFPLTKKMVQHLVVEIIKETGRQTAINLDKGPSNKWLKKFFFRHPELSARKPHPLDKSRASLTQEQIDQYFDLLEQTIKRLGLENDPTRIYNCDETGFSNGFNTAGQPVIVKKGARQAFQVKLSFSGHVTVNFAVSASGKTLPPFFIFSKNLPRENFTDGLPEEWVFNTTDSGFINSELFYSWFVDVFLKSCSQKKPCLLIMDNHVSHLTPKLINAAKSNGVDLLFFPSHASHLLQPLDVGYFHVLKKKLVDLATGIGYSGTRCLPRHLFPKFLQQAMNHISPATVAAAFSATGIFPLRSAPIKALSQPISETSKSKAIEVNESDVTENKQSTDKKEPCTACGCNKNHENMLVKIGMVPQHLVNVLIEPPALKKNKKRKNTIDTARVFQSDSSLPVQDIEDPIAGPSETKKQIVDSQSLKSKNKKSSSKTKRKPNYEMITDDESVLCTVCMTNRSDMFWVGCDRCEAWLHYECLPNSEQTKVDLSLICEYEWLCQQCRSEE